MFISPEKQREITGLEIEDIAVDIMPDSSRKGDKIKLLDIPASSTSNLSCRSIVITMFIVLPVMITMIGLSIFLSSIQKARESALMENKLISSKIHILSRPEDPDWFASA